MAAVDLDGEARSELPPLAFLFFSIEMLTSANLLKSVSELTSRADLRDSSSRTSSAFARMVSS